MNKQLPARFITVVFVLQQCFLFLSPVRAANSDIVVNEIAAYEPSGCEWVELYNKGNSPVNMDGWHFFENSTNHAIALSSSSLQRDSTIEPGEYAIITQDDTRLFSTCGYTPPAGTVFDSSWTTLSESGERIGLRDNGGTLVEDFTYVAAESASLERVDAHALDYTAANWRERGSGNTFGRANDPVIVSGTSNSSSTAQVVINEFSSNPNSGESEWVELYNMDDSPAQVTGWTLGDGAGTVATIAITIATHGFAVVDLSAAHLNNDGDVIVLRNSSGTIVDAVSYGSWDDGNIANNAPAPGRGYSTARRVDGAQSGNDGVDFAETMQMTKAAPNTIVSPPSTSVSSGSGSNASKPSASVSSILVNELMSMPGGDDEEFVELYNQTHTIIDLSGWIIKNGSHTTVLSGSIALQNYVVVYSPTGGLGNRGDSVSILDPSGREIDKVVYGVFDDGRSSEHALAPTTGLALARKIVGVDTDVYTSDFVLTDTPTPGKPNTIHLGVSTSAPTTTVILNELFPNPRGPDTLGEWIELENTASTSVSLAGWSIRDDSGSEYRIVSSTISPHGYSVFSRSVTGIALNNSRTETVTLVNAQGQTVDETSYSGSVGDDMSYARAPDGSWSWSVSSTRGQENRVVRPNSAPDLQVAVPRSVVAGEIVFFDSSDTVDPDNDDIVWFWDFGDGSTSTDAAPEHVFHDTGTFHSVVRVTDARGSAVSDTIRIIVKPGIVSSATKNSGSPKVQKSGARGSVNRTSLDGLGAAQTGDAVRVNGVVAVLPGVFGTQYFYIVDDTGAGVQIYMNKKNFPMLAVGDRVQVSGVLGSGAQGPRVKVTATNDIRILSHGGILSPHSSAVTDIDGELVGNLLRITGEVTDIKSAYVFVDDGTDEMKVYVKSGARISLAELHSGDRVTVTGILGMAAGGLQLWPRSQTDIVFASSGADRVQENISSTTSPIVASGESYVKAAAGGFATIVAGFAVRARAASTLPVLRQFAATLAMKLRRKKKYQ